MSLTTKQADYLMHCNHRWNVKTGATGSGKSFVDYVVTIPKRILSARGEGLIVLLGNTRGTLERNILEPMRTLYGADVGTIRQDNTVILFGKRCFALGADNKKHVARLQGASIEYAYGDEVTTWSADVFEMLKSRLRCQHSVFDGTCNPDSPGHWFKKFLDSDADIYQQSYVIDDGTLPAYVVDALKREYAGTVYYKRFILGLWAMAEGMIYPMYENALSDVPAGVPAKIAVSVDYGTLNAFAALKWGLWDDTWYAYDEYYHSGRDTGTQKTDAQYLEDLTEWTAPERARLADPELNRYPGKLRVIVDPSAASFIVAMEQSKKYAVIDADNDVLDGIRDVASCMQTGRIKICRNCRNTVQELGGYVWDESDQTKERPLKVADHAMDALRYFCRTENIAMPLRRYIPLHERYAI